MDAPSEKNPSTQANVAEVGPADQQPQINTEHAERMDGAFMSIIIGAAIPCGLILLIFGALIGVVLGTRVNRYEGYPDLFAATTTTASNSSNAVFTTLNTWRKQGGTAAFFIDFNPSSLTAIATLTGKIIPYLSSSIMALVAFFAARRIITNSKDTSGDRLLTPHQLSILVELLGGSSFAPLKNCVKHHVKHKQKWISPLPHAFSALAAVTALGIVIPLVDTWFSTTVTPSTIATVRKSNQTSTFGRAFDNSTCSNLTYRLNGTATAPCNLQWSENPSRNQTNYFLYGAQEAIETLDDISPTNRIWYYYDTKDNYYYFVGDSTFTYARYARDFQTKTLAVQTQCKPMTSLCLPPTVEGSDGYIATDYNFTCSKGFSGSLLSNGATSAANYNLSTHSGGVMAGLSFAPDANLSTKVNDSQFASFQNPLYFGAWSTGWQVPPKNDTNGNETAWDQDDEIFYDYFWNYVWMLNCNSTVYDVSYSFVNGTINTWNMSLTSNATGGMLSLPFVSGLPAASLCLGQASTSISKATDSDDLAFQWAKSFSRCAVSLLSGAMVSQNNTLEQTRNNSYSATRVPMVPLFFLLGLKLLYCLAVLLLAIAAWHYTNPAEAQSVKERLTVQGLAATCFADGASNHQLLAVKNVEQLFQPPTTPATTTTTTTTTTTPATTTTATVTAAGTGTATGDIEAAQGGQAPEVKVGMQPTELGGWQFVKLVAGKAWTQVEPIIEGEVLFTANAGALGATSKDAAQWVGLVKK